MKPSRRAWTARNFPLPAEISRLISKPVPPAGISRPGWRRLGPKWGWRQLVLSRRSWCRLWRPWPSVRTPGPRRGRGAVRDPAFAPALAPAGPAASSGREPRRRRWWRWSPSRWGQVPTFAWYPLVRRRPALPGCECTPSPAAAEEQCVRTSQGAGGNEGWPSPSPVRPVACSPVAGTKPVVPRLRPRHRPLVKPERWLRPWP